MKLHIPHQLFRAVLSCMSAVSFMALASVSSICYAADEEEVPKDFDGVIFNAGGYKLTGRGTVTFNGHSGVYGVIYNSRGYCWLNSNGNVAFCGNNKQNATYVSMDHGRGAAISNNGLNHAATVSLRNNGNVTFSGNTVTAYGGAISNYGSKASFKLVGNKNVSFYRNSANQGPTGGGAISNEGGTLMLNSNGDVTFSSNSAAFGGAILTAKTLGGVGAFTLSSNGDTIFIGNSASYYGGAIYNDGGTFTLSSNEDVTFSGNSASYGGAICNEGTVSLSGNGNVLFEKNVARTIGSVIYGRSGSDTAILRNMKVHFIDNSSSDATGTAVYTDGTLTIEDNAEVIFRNNGMAFHADTANIGTTSDSESRVRIFESFDVTTLNLNRNSAKGDICLSGKNAVGKVKETATLFSGVLALSDGAVMNIGQDMEISSVSALIVLNQGTRLNVGGNLTLGGASYLQFQLDRASGNVTPLISVQNDISFSASPIKILWQDGQTLPTSSDRYALIEVGKSFTYDNCTYTYENAVWKKGETEMSLSEMNQIFAAMKGIPNTISLSWENNVLYAMNPFPFSDRIWVKKGNKWYGGEIQEYNTKKKYILSNYQIESDKYKCWAVASANAIQYWQDKYAPLYQGKSLLTELRATNSADRLYNLFDGMSNNSGADEQLLLRWWLSNDDWTGLLRLTSKKILWNWANVDDYEAIPFWSSFGLMALQGNNWEHLNFDYPTLKIDRTSDICSFLRNNLDSGEAPLMLDYAIYQAGKFQNNHVVTLWGADFTYDATGNEILKTLYVTDSDNTSGIIAKDIVYIAGEAYYTYQDANNYRKITCLSGFKCTDDVDSMMKCYNNPEIALQWTGSAEGVRWVSSSAAISGNAHLAGPEDGWKKACSGSGKTIYAHAYFTQEAAPNCRFVFGNSVGGQKVTKKNVVLVEDLHVGSVQVSGTGYVFSGSHTLSTDALFIDYGADLRLRGGARIGKNAAISISGTLRIDEGCGIDSSRIMISPSGALWAETIALTDVGSASKDIVSLNFRDYQCVASEVRLSGCTIGNSGTLGCTIDMQGSTMGVVFSSDSLKKLVYNKLGQKNELMGQWEDYRYDFVIEKGVLNASYDDIKKQPVALSDSSLTVDAKDNSWVTLASYTGAPDLAGADINLSETSRTEVTAPQLVTAPEAAVLLNEQSVLNTKSFIVPANSSFRNEGTLQTLDGKGTVTVEKDASLSGSGMFSSVVSSGTLVVGSSPGAPQYESLTLNTGSTTVFYLDGITPATDEQKGWGNGLHSVMTVAGDLQVNEEANFIIGCSADFLSRCKAGETLSLTLIRSESALSDSLLPILQEQTQFYFAQTDNTLLPSEDYGFTVREHQWSFNEEKSALTLSWSIVSGVKDALVFQGCMDEPVAWVDAWQISEEEPVYYENDTPVAFYQGGHVVLNTTVRPGDMVVSAKDELTWSGEGGLKGSATLLKEDEGRLVLDISSPNYEGSVIITGGVLETRRADALGAGNVSLYGATLQTPAAHLNSLEMADDVTLLGGGTASNILLYDGTAVHAEDGFTLTDSGSLFLAGKADWMGDLVLSDASLVFSAGELSVTGTLTLSGDCELSLGDYAETGRYQLILCDNLSGDWESLAVSQRDDSFIYELVQEEKGLSLVVSSKEPNMYWGFAKGIWREGARFGIGSEGEELLFSAGTHVGFNGKAQVTISGKVYPRAVTVDSPQAVTFTADKKTAGSGIAGEAVLTKSGSGVLKLNAGNTYSGGTVLNAGTIKATAADSFGTGAITVNGGTLDLASKAVVNNITVNGAAVLKGAAKYAGNELAINGDLLKGTSVTAARTDQRIAIGGECSTITGTVKSAGLVEVNGTLNATAAKLTAAQLKLNGGVFTNTKGIKVAKNQTLTLAGGSLNTGLKALTAAAGSTLKVEKSATLSGALTLGGGALVLEDGVELSISGTLTLSKATALTLNGTATLTFGTLKAPKKGTLASFFGVEDDVTITQEGNTLVFNRPALTACAAPAAAEPEAVAAPALTPAVAPSVAELTKKAAAARPLGDALVMADWAIVDANRAFTGTLQSRRDSGVMLADGQGMAWVSAMGGVSRHGSENGHDGADVNLNGAAVGVEHTAGANSVLGLAVGHTWSRIGATGMQHLRQDTAHVALYGQTKLLHGFTAEWTAAYGDTDSKGTFNGTRETWSQKSTAISARLNKTHELTDSTAVRGFAGLSYDATDAASIHGMHTGSIQRLQGEVGAGITHRADKLTTYAEASVTTDLARNAPAVDFGAWRQNGATPGRTGLNLTLGAAYELTDKWSINASYHVEAAERATQHSFNVGAGRKF